jgi:hypothetical protein
LGAILSVSDAIEATNELKSSQNRYQLLCAGFVSLVYICIAVGDPIIKRRRECF